MDNKIPNMDYDADEVINEFKEKIKWPKSDEVTAVVKPTKIPLRLLISFLITAVVGGIAYYMMLPALNFKVSFLNSSCSCIYAFICTCLQS